MHRVVAETMVVNLTLIRTFRQPWPYPIDGHEHGDVEYALDKADWEKAATETR